MPFPRPLPFAVLLLAACSESSTEPLLEVDPPAMAQVGADRIGGAFVFAGPANGGPLDVYVVNPDGSGLTNLTNDPAHQEAFPAWSPNGRRIVFSRRPDGGEADLWLMDHDGGDLTRVTSTPDVTEQQADWSPDGRFLVFVRARGFGQARTSALIVHELRTGAERTLKTVTAAFLEAPKWSPDGRLIVFAHYEFSGHSEIVGITPDGTAETALFVPDVPAALDPSWSPDGRSILFSGPGGNVPTAIWIMDRDGTDPRVLLPVEAYRPIWLRGTTTIAFDYGTIQLIDADGSERRDLGLLDSGFDWRPGGPIR